jgi:hypothetical protein
MEGPLKPGPPPGSLSDQNISPHPGLCADCVHAREITSARGSTFWRCALSDTNPTFPKYPRVPVISCLGFEQLSARERNRADD